MSNYLNWSMQFGYTGAAGTITNRGVSGQVTIANSQPNQKVVATSVTAAALTYSLTGTPSAVMLINLDATNSISVSTDSGMTQTFATIPPGQSIFLVPSSGVTYYVQASAGTPLLEIEAC